MKILLSQVIEAPVSYNLPAKKIKKIENISYMFTSHLFVHEKKKLHLSHMRGAAKYLKKDRALK